jgi:CubicO group peptidase (beta-lactamase class C family)
LLPLAVLLFAPNAAEADLRAACREAMEYWRCPGVAVAAVKDGKVVLLAGFGTRHVGKDEPVTPDTLFSLGSNGKAFTTAAMAMLVEEGKLKWGDRVGKHLPGFRLSDADVTRKVTLEDLLSHRTGLAGNDLLWYRSGDSPAEMVLKAGLLPLSKPFRKEFQYQSVMFTAAGLAAERAAGMPWQDLIRTRLLTPLGMKSTFTDSESAFKYREMAAPHFIDGAERVAARPLYRWPGPNAAGSIYSTARDLVPWVRFQLDGTASGGKRLIPLARLHETHKLRIALKMLEMERPVFEGVKNRGYALAWVAYDHRGHRWVAHGGMLEGHRCHIALVPEKGVAVAVLTNLHMTALPAALATRLTEMLLGQEPRDWNALYAKSAEVARKSAPERPAPKEGTRPTLGLKAYAGTYVHPAYGAVRVTLGQGYLAWSWRRWRGTLDHRQDDTFDTSGMPLGEAEARFRVKGGKVRGVYLTGQLNVEFRREE